MGRRKGFWDDVEDIIQDIGKFFKWLYDNIIWAVLIVLLADIFIFLTVEGYYIFSIINGIILITFGIKVWVESSK